MPAPDDLSLLVEAAREAGEIASRYWRTDQEVRDKGAGAGPVSEADLAVDAHLRQRLTAARPDYGWLSEETEDTPARLAARRCFIVDPIDGTRAYVEGQRDWAHSLAITENGRPIAACVYLPQRDKLYTAAAGAGARLNDAPIRVAGRDREAGAKVLSNTASLNPALWPRGLPDVKRHFRPSIAYRLCLVAEGAFDAMLTLRPTWHWDVAAGALVCAEAGAKVADQAGAVLRFNTPEPRSPGCLAAAPALTDALLARLAPA